MPMQTFFNTSVEPIPVRPQKSMVVDNIQVGGGQDASYITGQIVKRTPVSVSTYSNLANGSGVTNKVTVTNNYNKRLLGIIERAVYVDSVAAANLLPGGASIDETDWQIIGSNFSVIDTGGTPVVDNKLFNHLFLHNISAGTVNLIFHVHVRYILNTGAVS